MDLRLLLLSFFFLSALTPVSAQRASLSGRVVDGESREALIQTTLQLFRIEKKDTSFLKGALTDGQGRFAISNIPKGNYLLRISHLGYKESVRSLSLTSGRNTSLADILMQPSVVELQEAVVTANLPKMTIKDDTVVYNADAFRVPEGSVIEALVEMLPGAKIDDNGGISINGKNVKKFKMDGRDFMTGNNDAVMKNLPSYVIDKVKAYDEKSDLSRLTGVDDGNDDFVLEFVTKRSARRGLQANPDIGYGTDQRYGLRLTAMKPFGAMRYTFMGNANNVNGRNFSGRGGRGRGNGSGQRETKTAALDISYENNKDLKVSGRVTWDRNDADNWNRTGSESFVKTRGGAFSNSVNQSYSRSNGWTGNMNLQWTIDSLTTLSFRPNVNISSNNSRNTSTSASFNANPYDFVTAPLSEEGRQTMHEKDQIVNDRLGKSLGYSESRNISSQIQLYRRFGNKGRNVAISGNINYRDGDSRNASLSRVHLYQTQDQYGNDSTYQTNRYTLSPSLNFSYSIGGTYTEPLWTPPQAQANASASRSSSRGGRRGQRSFGAQGLFLQLNLRYNYSHQKNDPSTYDFPDLSDEAFADVLNQYREWNRLFGYLDNPYEEYLSDRLSRFSERTEHGYNADVQLRFVREKYNMNVGVSIQPQRSHYIQQYLGLPVDTVRTVANMSPTLNWRYRPNQQTNLQVTLRGNTQQPSITQLLDIYDDTNPLNITMGNPGLKPSFTTNFSTNFQMQRPPAFVEDSLGMQIPKQQRHWSFSVNGNWQRTSNSVGNVVTYNETTGGRISKPENINGNWSLNGGSSFNVGLDTLNRWDVSGGLSGSYSHHVGYVNLNRTAQPDRNVTHTYNLTPSASLSYRVRDISFSLNARATYARTENRLQASRNLSTWNISYGGNTKITFPWETTLSTDIHIYSKRGYSDETLNTNEVIWNAQLSHSFLRGKKLMVMLQWYDILHQQTNFSRNVNANGWTDREVHAITTYAMLHVSYRLNFFGNSYNMERGPRGESGSRGERGRREWRNF